MPYMHVFTFAEESAEMCFFTTESSFHFAISIWIQYGKCRILLTTVVTAKPKETYSINDLKRSGPGEED